MLQKAGNAKNTVNDSELEEKIRLAYQDYYLGQYSTPGYSFQDALDAMFGKNVASAEPGENGVYTVSVNGKTYEFNPVTQSLEPIVAWTKNEDGSYSMGTGAEKVTIHVGDQVNYDPTKEATGSTTYTSPASKSGKTGNNADQSFDAATYKNAGFKWRVLDVKNGKIRLIADTDIGPGDYSENATTYELEGKTGYINGKNELNKICSIFGNGKGADSATSLTVDDVNTIAGYNPENSRYNQGSFDEYLNKVTYTRGSGSIISSSATNGQSWSGTQSIFKYYNGTGFIDLTGSTTITSTAYNYNLDVTKAGILNSDGTFSAPYEVLFGNYKYDIQNDYDRSFKGNREHFCWIASDFVKTDIAGADWGLRLLDRVGINSNYTLFTTYDNEYNWGAGVRPVVSLKSNVNIKWNSTATEWQIQ